MPVSRSKWRPSQLLLASPRIEVGVNFKKVRDGVDPQGDAKCQPHSNRRSGASGERTTAIALS